MAVTEPDAVPLRFDYSPWLFRREAGTRARQEQQQHQQQLLTSHPGWRLGAEVFLSPLASLQADHLVLGDRSYVAAHAYLSDDVVTGRDCTVNAFSVVRGRVRLGDGVRVGAHSSLLGFNHTTTDPDLEVFRQPLSSRGISVGDDVWIGSHVVVVDGVSVGARAVLAAGAVVTKDVPAGAVVGGNPARLLRWRVPPVGPTPDGSTADGSPSNGSASIAGSAARSEDGGPARAERLQRLCERVREQLPEVLQRCWVPELSGGQFLDRPGAEPSVRAQCDAVELADLWLGSAPEQLPAADQAVRLAGWQDPASGLLPELDQQGLPGPVPPGWADGELTPSSLAAGAYHVLCAGYALDLLGQGLPHPVHAVTARRPEELVRALAGLPWHGRAWGAGAFVDTVGTALRWDLPRGNAGSTELLVTLFGWLGLHVDPRTGMWGSSDGVDADRQLVNGFYRASRGSYAQFGLPLPHPDRVIDTVLAHARDPHWFAPERQNACNVLDVAHPLWLAGQQSGHRREEVILLAGRLLDDALGHWQDHRGFGFAAPRPAGEELPASVPGLQGTEMWSAILWLLADLVGLSEMFPRRPRGVHRPGPAVRLPPVG